MGLGAVDGKNANDDVSQHFEDESFEKTLDHIIYLSDECYMRKINAMQASKAFKNHMKTCGSAPMEKSHFVDFMIKMMKKHDFCDTKSEEDQLRSGFDEVFNLFDYDKSGALDCEEAANCLSLMCGGSINEKIWAAFNLFD